MTDLDEWDTALYADASPDVRGAHKAAKKKAKGKPAKPQPKFVSVEHWVRDYLAPMVTQQASRGTAWCPQWWQHAEGILRLEALWRSWEHLHRDGKTGLSAWLRDHRDPHMTFLFNQDVSPFTNCSVTGGHKDGPAPLLVHEVPAGWTHPDEHLREPEDEDETDDDDKAAPPPPQFPDVQSWVTDWLAPVVTQQASNRTAWCPQWWQHLEAIRRLDGLWQSWEHLRLDGTTGMSVWLRDHRDPHMTFLFDTSTSPFSNCLFGQHREPPAALVVEAAPADWWSA
ncbi:protein of unknown function [Lentzea albidocapillata subsp. violacea]|uniref:DUF4913 domain-containing protein n=1 Tax=Lentzea albidocapillata subsp. violacea TaxID=128104 RepID=A0A1G9YWL2_9PSEU|nr:DUF4913 domain-containing protein [Lentzea albidocapillata]SDN13538.1 protein of unknown function [Lentzea albidocapillata subsp. violacea]